MTKIRLRHIFTLFFLSLLLQLAGGKLNQIVEKANHDTMPVWVFNGKMLMAMMGDQDHSIMDKDSRYKVLSDIFPLMEAGPEGITVGAEASLGDFLYFSGQVGCFLTIFAFLGYPFIRLWGLYDPSWLDRIRNREFQSLDIKQEDAQ